MKAKDCPEWVVFFGEALKHGISGFNWPYGGGNCLTFAKALKQYLGERASLWAIGWPKEDGEERLDIVSHVAVKVGDCFLDGFGAWTEKELMRQWHPKSDARLEPYDYERRQGLHCPPGLVDVYYRKLVRFFGEPEEHGLRP
jgi:hypothetical protein